MQLLLAVCIVAGSAIPTGLWHGQQFIRQQLQHVVEALADGLLAPLGQVLLQVEALDLLAAGVKSQPP